MSVRVSVCKRALNGYLQGEFKLFAIVYAQARLRLRPAGMVC